MWRKYFRVTKSIIGIVLNRYNMSLNEITKLYSLNIFWHNYDNEELHFRITIEIWLRLRLLCNIILNEIQSYNNRTITYTYLKQYTFTHIKNSIEHTWKYYKWSAKHNVLKIDRYYKLTNSKNHTMTSNFFKWNSFLIKRTHRLS